MLKYLLIIIAFASSFLLTGCAPPIYGVSRSTWDCMTPEQQQQAMIDYYKFMALGCFTDCTCNGFRKYHPYPYNFYGDGLDTLCSSAHARAMAYHDKRAYRQDLRQEPPYYYRRHQRVPMEKLPPDYYYKHNKYINNHSNHHSAVQKQQSNKYVAKKKIGKIAQSIKNKSHASNQKHAVKTIHIKTATEKNKNTVALQNKSKKTSSVKRTTEKKAEA